MAILRTDKPDATEKTVKSAIVSLRSCYRKEQRKIKESKKSGAGADEIHKPKLWYFPMLNFLEEDPEKRPGTSSLTLEGSDVQSRDSQETDLEREV